RGVAVDVKDLSGRAIKRRGRDDRNPARVDEVLEERAVDKADPAHETELGILPLRAEHPAVDPGQADRGYAASEKRGDNAPVRKPTEHREREIARFGVGHAKATHEAGLHSQ